jgi:hypothetical protein
LGWACKFCRVALIRIFGFFTLLRYETYFFLGKFSFWLVDLVVFRMFGWACKFRRVAPKRIFGSFTLLRYYFYWENARSDWLIWCFNIFFRILCRACKFCRFKSSLEVWFECRESSDRFIPSTIHTLVSELVDHLIMLNELYLKNLFNHFESAPVRFRLVADGGFICNIQNWSFERFANENEIDVVLDLLI